MPELVFEGITISSMAGAVPKNKIVNRKFTKYFDEQSVSRYNHEWNRAINTHGHIFLYIPHSHFSHSFQPLL